FPSLVLEGKQTFVGEYGLDREYWQLHSASTQPETVAALKANLMDLAQHFHALAQKDQGEEDYARAVHYYRMHIAYFPEDPDTANTNFLLAELLFESGRYLEAVEEYERTAYGYQLHDKAAEAGYAALVSYQKVEDGLAPEQREDWHRRSIESSLRFAGEFTDHPQAMAVLTKASEDLFELRELDLSIAVADQVIQYGSASADQLIVVWTVKAHALFDLEQFADAEIAYLQLLSLTPADDVKRGEISERIAASVYKQGELRRAEGDMTGAAMDFLRVAQVAPGASIVATAEYDAAAALLVAQDWQGAIPVLERFRRDYPENEFAFEATRSLALAYRESGQGVAAADEFVRIAASTDAGVEMQQQSLLEAADLYASAADPRERATLEAYVEKFPYPLEQALTARERLANLAGAASDSSRRAYWLESIVEADAQAGAERSVRSRTLAAHASLELAEPRFHAFEGVKLVAPLNQSIKLKKQAMEDALGAYGRAADYGIAEVTTAATFYIADVYFQFSRDLFDSERPDDMSVEEADQYDLLLEEQAYPFEEQAIEIHQANTSRASEGVYDEWVRKSFERLAELLPARYAKAEMGVPAVENIN
ncbi:MAG: tetratricopeptide repeat protein, partial [Chromatiales bacterium]|nr:tetratricopeptide repeat protein [Chromatiales bacterium]